MRRCVPRVEENKFCSQCSATVKMKRVIGTEVWVCPTCGHEHKHEWKRIGGYLQADRLREKHLVCRAEDLP